MRPGDAQPPAGGRRRGGDRGRGRHHPWYEFRCGATARGFSSGGCRRRSAGFRFGGTPLRGFHPTISPWVGCRCGSPPQGGCRRRPADPGFGGTPLRGFHPTILRGADANGVVPRRADAGGDPPTPGSVERPRGTSTLRPSVGRIPKRCNPPRFFVDTLFRDKRE